MPYHISHDPTIQQTIDAVEAVLDAHRDLRLLEPATRASFNGAALQLVELIAHAVEERIKRRTQIEDISTDFRLTAESHKIAR